METGGATGSWSISVKTVGNQLENSSSDFTILVSPEDNLKSLHQQIEEFTGLKASQQRLIYRGRLIGDGCNENNTNSPGKGQPKVDCPAATTTVQKNEPRVRDVIGLGDGQTIHLVPRPAAAEAETAASEAASSPAQPDTAPDAPGNRNEEDGNNSSSALPSSNGTVAFLAALLGLNSDESDDSPTETSGGTSGSIGQQLQRLRSARIRNRSRRPHHRLTAADIAQPLDPGSAEPVRQGLMTLHTLLQAHQLGTGASSSSSEEPTLFHNRQWYRGQWIDCRDTVNQWLEATVVDIVSPEEILPSSLQHTSRRRRRTVVDPTTDAAVSANDFQGRMRLLLEESNGDPFEDEEFRARENNEGVHLLLIHYNGWPHRWDEWIRSDSERIRPFRTRTRHPNNSSTACPTPQSAFNAAPSTHFKDDNETSDRQALLPEIQRILSVINNMVTQSVELMDGVPSAEESREDHLPWLGAAHDNDDLNDENSSSPMLAPMISGDDDMMYDSQHGNSGATNGPLLRQQLQMLAPLLDRLGRTLTDAAPHIASYASTLPEATATRVAPTESSATRESNVHIVGDIPDDLPDLISQEWDLGRATSRSSRRGGPREESQERRDPFLPLLSEEAQELEDADSAILADPVPEPDYVDFINGMVNTTRGEVRTRGSRRNASNSSSDDASSLLGAYLAAASLSNLINTDDDEGDSGLQGLGRLIRQRDTNGGNGGGIDIHIHAIVTGPGVGNGGGGMAIIGSEAGAAPGGGGGGGGSHGGGNGGTAATTTTTTTTAATTTTRPSLFSNSNRSSAMSPDSPRIAQTPTVDEDDLGIFDDLYSDNPSPIDLQNGLGPEETDVDVPSATLPIDLGSEDQEEELLSHVNTSRASAVPVWVSTTSSSSSSAEVPPPTRPSRTLSSANSVNSSGGRRGNAMSRLIRRISSRRGGLD